MATTSTGAALTKGARITGEDRQALGAQLSERYQAGESIRVLAQDTGRSFGFVHGLIKESGVPLRGRGGATRRSAPGVVPAAPAVPPVDSSSTVDDTPTKANGGQKKKAGVKKADAKKAVGKKAAAQDEGKKSGTKKEKAGKKKGRS